MNFGEKLTNLRKQKGLSQEELSEELNVTRQTISKWEAGQTSPDINKITEVANFFGVTVNELTNDEEIKYNDGKVSVDDGDNKKPTAVIILVIVLGIALLAIPIIFFTTFFGKVFNIGKDMINNSEEKVSQFVNQSKDMMSQFANQGEDMVSQFANQSKDMFEQMENGMNISINNSTKETRAVEEIQKDIDELNESLIPLKAKRQEEFFENMFSEEFYRLDNEINKIESQVMSLKRELSQAQH